MNYQVVASPSARRQMNQLPESVAAAVFELLSGDLGRTPHRLGGRLHGIWDGYLSARRGSWRILYRVDDEAHVVYVERVENRGKVYRS